MAELTPLSDNLNVDDFQKKPLPGGLNVLTILTIIWCVLSLLFAAGGFMTAEKKYNSREEDMAKMQQAPSWLKSIIPSGADYETMVTKNNENKIPILLLSVVGIVLCFVGALQMRKRKKQGYILYVIGELLPFVTTIFFIGTFMFTGIAGMIGSGIALLFILLYTAQRKNLIY